MATRPSGVRTTLTNAVLRSFARHPTHVRSGERWISTSGRCRRLRLSFGRLWDRHGQRVGLRLRLRLGGRLRLARLLANPVLLSGLGLALDVDPAPGQLGRQAGVLPFLADR
jgi:hypothetical protein